MFRFFLFILQYSISFFFFFNDTATTEIYTLSYTTLFRSAARLGDQPDLEPARLAVHLGHREAGAVDGDVALGEHVVQKALRNAEADRSEEHTSELQSPCNLVCRLLLEKKKKKRQTALMYMISCLAC